MYNPPLFNESRLDVQHALIRAFPLGLLITAVDGPPEASPLPFTLSAEQGTHGVLQSHCSRANAHWQTIDGASALVVFQGTDSYVTPAWYAAKQEHGKVVPTWNYATVQARGTVRIIQEAEWLRAQIERLTDDHEAAREHPWQVSDAPAAYIEALIKGIVGIEIEIASIEGKWKVSQNRSEADRRTVAAGLDVDGQPAMADLVRRYGGI